MTMIKEVKERISGTTLFIIKVIIAHYHKYMVYKLQAFPASAGHSVDAFTIRAFHKFKPVASKGDSHNGYLDLIPLTKQKELTLMPITAHDYDAKWFRKH